MHDCSQLSLAFVVIKPSCTKLVNSIMNIFEEMNFQIAYQKFIELDNRQAGTFLSWINPESNEKVDLHEWKKGFHVLGLVKPAAKKEILALLS